MSDVQTDTIDNAPWNKAASVPLSLPQSETGTTPTPVEGTQVPTIDSAPWNAEQKPSYEDSIHPILGKYIANVVSGISGAAKVRQSVMDAWSQQGEAGLSEQNAAELSKSGVFNKPGENNLIKSGAEVGVRASAYIFDAINRPVQSALEGLFTAIDTATNPEIGKETRRFADYLMTGAPGVHFTPGSFHIPPEHAEALASYVQRADESVYMGTKTASPEEAAVAQAATESLRRVGEPTVTETKVNNLEKPLDINTAARNVSPKVFSEYDSLTTRRDFYTETFRDLISKYREDVESNSPYLSDIKDLQDKIDESNPRKAKIYQSKIDELTAKNEEYVEEKMNPVNFSNDIKNVRGALSKISQRIGDLAPDVKEAYRVAQENLPNVEAVEPALKETKAEENLPAGISEPVKEGEQKLPWGPKPLIDDDHIAIAGDVAKRLINAGRPEEEANAAAALVAEHYKAISEQGWVKGSPIDVYKKYGADIEKGRERAKTLAQGGKELSQRSKANIKLATDDARATIRLFKSADASSFIHETGHQWLEEMLRFSKEEDAPESLKNDVSTVRDWLGAKEGEEIATRQHEKFARGFERYMTEGVAPSKQLAGVFAKFKEWLLRIYQTVERLKSPITDDIRDVFDRLLSSKPEKTVIGPDHEPGKLLADIHEADAKNTPVEKAEHVADNVRDEVNKTIKTHDLEVYHDIKSAENDPNAAQATGNKQPGSAAGSTAGENSSSQERGAINSGGTGSTPASGPWTTLAGTTEGGTTGARGSKLGAAAENGSPGSKFAASKHDLIDKAGNIRIDLLNTTEDINKVLRDTATANNDFKAERRGVISDGIALDLADALGMNPSLLDTRKIGQAFNAEQIIKATRLLVQSAKEVSDAAKSGNAELYLESVERHKMIQGHVSGITAEAGRALRTFQNLKNIEGYDQTKALSEFLNTQQKGKTLNQLEEEMMWASNLKDARQVSKFIEDSKNNRFKNAIIEYYVNALISGPITHTRYMVGNAVNALWRPLVEIPIAAAVGKDVYIREAQAQLYALGKGSRDGLRAAIDAFTNGFSENLPGEHGNAQFFSNNRAIPGKIGELINIPSKSVAAIHSFFKALRYEQNIAGLSVRTALKEGLEYGSDEFTNRVSDLSTRPTDEMMDEAGNIDPNKIEPAKFTIIEDAAADALKELYMAPNEYHSTMGMITRATNNSLPLKIMMPFMKIGTQITRNAFIERTPLGLLNKDIRANLSGVNGGAARDMQIGKMVAGTALISASVLAASEGLMTGDGPEDPKERNVWLLNNKPNHLTIGNVSIPYQGLGSLGMLMRFSSNMHQTASMWDEKDGGKIALAALQGLTKSVLDENFMRGAKDALDAMYHSEEYLERYLQNFATNWLPFSVGLGQMNRSSVSPVQDTYQRDVHSEGLANAWGIMDAARAKIPGLSEGLHPRRDMFGREILNDSKYDDYKNDPVVQRLEALHTGIGRLERKINGVQLSEKQYDDYSRISGVQTKLMLNALISPSFQFLPPGEQILQINKTIGEARKVGAAIVKSNPENQDILQKAIAAKRAIFTPSQNP